MTVDPLVTMECWQLRSGILYLLCQVCLLLRHRELHWLKKGGQSYLSMLCGLYEIVLCYRMGDKLYLRCRPCNGLTADTITSARRLLARCGAKPLPRSS